MASTTRKKPVVKSATRKTTKPIKKVVPVKSAPAPGNKSLPPLAKPLSEALAKPKAEKKDKVKKPKMVRDSFSFPKTEYTVLDTLKQRALKLVRAGIKAMTGMTDAAFLQTLKSVPTIKTGRPKKA